MRQIVTLEVWGSNPHIHLIAPYPNGKETGFDPVMCWSESSRGSYFGNSQKASKNKKKVEVIKMNWKTLAKQSIIAGVCTVASVKITGWILDLIKEKVDERHMEKLDERLHMLQEEIDELIDEIGELD